MDSPRPGVVTINSRQARRASSVWGIPSFANRLLQVGLLSSIASRPLSPATSAIAVSISSRAFILKLLHFQFRISGAPEFAGALSPLGYDSPNHFRASAAAA